MACDTVSGAAATTACTAAARGRGTVVAGEPAALVSARLGGTRATARPVTTAAMRRRGMTTGTGSPVGRWSRVGDATHGPVGRWPHERVGTAVNPGSVDGLTFVCTGPRFGRRD